MKRLEALALAVVTNGRLSPAEHKQYVENEMTRWATVIKASSQYADQGT